MEFGVEWDGRALRQGGMIPVTRPPPSRLRGHGHRDAWLAGALHHAQCGACLCDGRGVVGVGQDCALASAALINCRGVVVWRAGGESWFGAACAFCVPVSRLSWCPPTPPPPPPPPPVPHHNHGRETTAMASYSALTHTRHHTRSVPGVPGSAKRRFCV